MTRGELPFIMSNPGKVANTVIVVGAIGLIAVAIETLRMRMNGWLALAVVSLILLVMALMIHPAFPHDHNNPERNDYLKSLYAKGGAWCCNGDDVTYLDGSDWETKGNRYRVRIDGEWLDVPDSAVIEAPNKLGTALVWIGKGYSGISVRCFAPGSMT